MNTEPEPLISRIAQTYFQAGKTGKNALTETATNKLLPINI